MWTGTSTSNRREEWTGNMIKHSSGEGSKEEELRKIQKGEKRREQGAEAEKSSAGMEQQRTGGATPSCNEGGIALRAKTAPSKPLT